MAKCRHCGAETELHYSGVPICLGCAEAPEKKPNRPAQVNAELTAAREEYRKALAVQLEAEEIRKALPLGHPDGTAALHNANQQLSLASQRYRNALTALTDLGRPKT
jgi:hypothetical protein